MNMINNRHWEMEMGKWTKIQSHGLPSQNTLWTRAVGVKQTERRTFVPKCISPHHQPMTQSPILFRLLLQLLLLYNNPLQNVVA